MISSRVNHRQDGFVKHLLLTLSVVGVGILVFLKVSEGHTAAASYIIKSGVSGYCLDDYRDSTVPEDKVMLLPCNDSTEQNWMASGDKIVHYSACLSVQNDSRIINARIISNTCDDSPGQVWLRDNQGYFNPNSGMCLAAHPTYQAEMHTCNTSVSPDETWSAVYLNSGHADQPAADCPRAEGQRIACFAEREWTLWQSDQISHSDLLNAYTDGTPYEAWCADFVSYVYKEAGYPFTQAYAGWDENNANNIQNYGFTIHEATSGYIPKPGDIAYFDYNGGHVEIVASGGQSPTFIYGNSATIDPATGNGQMKANTITNDGAEGQLSYYLSPY